MKKKEKVSCRKTDFQQDIAEMESGKKFPANALERGKRSL